MHWIPRLIGVVPFGIGLTVLISLWVAPFGEFGSPPLFFRIFGSFIALGFVLFGIMWFVGPSLIQQQGGLLKHVQHLAEQMRKNGSAKNGSEKNTVGYDCPQCGAALGDKAEVSPSGDVKCQYCRRWFNIHSPGA